jgi:hypothetical protein
LIAARLPEEGETMRRLLALALVALAAGCASTVELTLMPRDSGKLYRGTADGSGDEGRIAITIEDKAYAGTWVQTSPARTSGYVTGGWGRRGGWGLGSYTADNPNGGEAKALLTAADGSGLRCDLRGSWNRGGGLCRDDRGREYDVQIRPAEKSAS